VDQAYATAKELLEERRDQLVAISEHLMQVETIDGAELDRLLFGVQAPTIRESEHTSDDPVAIGELTRSA